MLLISLALIICCRAYSDLKANPEPDKTLETYVIDDWQTATASCGKTTEVIYFINKLLTIERPITSTLNSMYRVID